MMFYRFQFTRMVAQDARLLRAAKGRLLATRRATALLEASGTSDLFRIMFETAFWRINLAYFDGLPIDHWPQTHIGVVLWSLSVAAHDWTKPDELLSTCTMPEPSPPRRYSQCFRVRNDYACPAARNLVRLIGVQASGGGSEERTRPSSALSQNAPF